MIMNNDVSFSRSRGKILFIVEGHHEKECLLWLIFKTFPEMNIEVGSDNVWIYGTKIYSLYEDITNEYGSDWIDTVDDVDLALVISKKKSEAVQYKTDFTDIILIFDYERHDPSFSEHKIMSMQKYFADSTGVGKLYINYPMIESYKHFKSLPDNDFLYSKIAVSMQPGRKYKNFVNAESGVKDYFALPDEINKVLKERFGIADSEVCKYCCNKLLMLTNKHDLEKSIIMILGHEIDEKTLCTAKKYFKVKLSNFVHVNVGLTYWEFMREIFIGIICHNIFKAYRIQTDLPKLVNVDYEKYFRSINHMNVLEQQNRLSENDGFIWILNTSVLLIPDYNYQLIV